MDPPLKSDSNNNPEQLGSQLEHKTPSIPTPIPHIPRRYTRRHHHTLNGQVPVPEPPYSTAKGLTSSGDGTFFPRRAFDPSSNVTRSSQPSCEVVARRRHLMESQGALILPPLATSLCIVHVLLYLYPEKLNIHKEEDIHVSWEHVIDEGEYWRLFVAQFFHFSKFAMLVNSATMFTIARYLERKITMLAMLAIILIMSATTQMIYILIDPWLCNTPKSASTHGFGNIIYCLRVLLAYALEPRNYERDLVFGLYPMVVSASHAPWQPILDLAIFKIVFPEQCITGQLSGIVAGFLVSAILLLWPTKGVYIATPPYYWTLMGTTDPGNRKGSEGGDEEYWRLRVYDSSDFWLPAEGTSVVALQNSENSFDTVDTRNGKRDAIGKDEDGTRTTNNWGNSMQRRSVRAKKIVTRFCHQPVESVGSLIHDINVHFRRPRDTRSDSDIGKQSLEEIHNKISEFLQRRSMDSMRNYESSTEVTSSTSSLASCVPILTNANRYVEKEQEIRPRSIETKPS